MHGIDLIPSLLLLIGALAVLIGVVAASREGAALLIVALVVWHALTAGRLPDLFSVGPILVHPADLLSVSLVVVAGLRLGRRAFARRLSVPAMAGLGIVALLLVSFARGVVTAGLQPAGVGVRPYFYLASAAAYFASASPVWNGGRALVRVWVVGALALMAVAFARWAILISGLPVAITWQAQGLFRVLNGAQTLFIAQALIAVIYVSGFARSRQVRWLSYVLAAVAMVMQQRTVWVTAMVAVVLLLLFEAHLRRHALRTLGAGAVGAVTILAVFTLVSGSPGTRASSLSATAAASGSAGRLGVEHYVTTAGNSSTFRWRVLGWMALLRKQGNDPVSLAIGRPFGSGFARTFHENGVTFKIGDSPHNFYLRTFLRVGFFGLGLLLLLYALVLRGLRDRGRAREGRPVQAWPRALTILLIMQLVYGLAYSFSIEQGMLFGVAMALARPEDRSRRPSEA